MGNALTSDKVLTYLTSNADRPIALGEIETALPLTRSQISNSLGNLMRSKKYPQLEQLQRGVFRWNSIVAAKAARKTEMLVSIMMRKDDGSMLVRDTEDEKVYVVRLLEF